MSSMGLQEGSAGTLACSGDAGSSCLRVGPEERVLAAGWALWAERALQVKVQWQDGVQTRQRGWRGKWGESGLLLSARLLTLVVPLGCLIRRRNRRPSLSSPQR